MFHSQHCQHLGLCPGKTPVAPMAFLPRASSLMVVFHPSPTWPALQMEMNLTSLRQLTIWLILFSDQGKSSLFPPASFILFSLLLSPCCPPFSALAPFAFLLAVGSSVCCPLVSHVAWSYSSSLGLWCMCFCSPKYIILLAFHLMVI